MRNKYLYPGAAALFLALFLAGLMMRRQPQEEPNVLFITIDTLRSDHLGCYGYDKIKTPNIDALARYGTMFENVFAQVPLTFPSHVSLFTSTYPQFNKALDNGNYRLDDSAVTLAEVMQKNGYATAAFVSSFVLRSKFGLNQGFETYDDSLEKIKKKRVIKFMDEERTAGQVTEAALGWLRLHKDKKFFLWVHYYDPHAVYNPPSPYKEIYKDDLYDGEIAYVDHFIGVLLEGFKDNKIDKNTLIIVASDHGEGLGEHDETGHGIFLYDTTLKVPLIFFWEGKVPTGRRVNTQVRLVDVMPTVLDLLHIKKNKEIQGVSLISLIKGALFKIKDLPAYSESSYAKAHFNWEELESWRQNGWKYIKSSEPQLYDIRHDPNELRNLFSKRERLAETFDGRMAQFVRETGSAVPEKKMEVDKETEERLMSLGYVQGTGSAEIKGPIPMKMVKVMEKMNLGDRLANEGLMGQAIKVFLEVIAQDPNNIDANLHLAQCYKETGRYDEAIKYFKKAASFNPGEVEVHNGLGNIYKSMGRAEEAFKEFSIAHELDPKDPVTINNLGWYYQQKMEIGKAMEQYRRALELDNKLATTHVNIAILYRIQKKPDEAMEELNAALKLEPELAFAYSELCACVATKGDISKAIPYCQKSIDLDADNIDGYNNLGVCYERQGELQKALENYKKALLLAPWNTLFYCNIANVYLALHEPGEARTYLERALKINPKAPKALRMLKALTGKGK